MLKLKESTQLGLVAAALFSHNKILKALTSLDGKTVFPEERLFSRVWDYCREKAGNEEAFNLLVVKDELNLTAEEAEYLVDLEEATPISSNVDFYLEQLEAALLKDKLFQTAITLQNEDKLSALKEQALQQINDIATLTLRTNTEIASLTEHYDTYYKHLLERESNDYVALTCGFPSLDRHRFYGLGKLITLAGTPGTGKTLFAVNVGIGVAKRGRPVMMFSFEMGANELLQRITAAQSRIPLHKLDEPKYLTEAEWSKLNDNIEKFKIPFFMSDVAVQTLADIVTKIKEAKQKYDVELIIIDYLQIMIPPKEDVRLYINEVTRTLKLLAKELNIVVLLLSQLSREVYKSADKKPKIHHLKESSSIEADSDAVILLHRDVSPQQVLSRFERSATTNDLDPETQLDVMIAKNRGGKRDVTVRMIFEPEFSRVQDPEEALR